MCVCVVDFVLVVVRTSRNQLPCVGVHVLSDHKDEVRKLMIRALQCTPALLTDCERVMTANQDA